MYPKKLDDKREETKQQQRKRIDERKKFKNEKKMKTFRLHDQKPSHFLTALFSSRKNHHPITEGRQKREKDDDGDDDFFCPARTGCNSSGRVWIRSVLRDNFYERLLEEE